MTCLLSSLLIIKKNETPNLMRPLAIDFSLYADNDLDFINQFASLIIDNLVELQLSLKESISVNDLTSYRNACHKVHSTLVMLEDQEFVDTIEEVKRDLANSSFR